MDCVGRLDCVSASWKKRRDGAGGGRKRQTESWNKQGGEGGVGRKGGSPSGVRDSRGCGRLEGANRIVINVKWRREQGTENGGAS